MRQLHDQSQFNVPDVKVKPFDILGTKGGNIWKVKLMNLKQNCNNRNIRDVFRSVKEFNKDFNPRTRLFQEVISWQLATVF